MHGPVSSRLLFHRLRPVVPERTLLFTPFPHIPPWTTSPSHQSSVTTAVCQLSACPSLVGWMKPKHRGSTGKTAWPLCLSQLSLPLQTSTYHELSFLPLASALEVFHRTNKSNVLRGWCGELNFFTYCTSHIE